jgi:hypothetical protein
MADRRKRQSYQGEQGCHGCGNPQETEQQPVGLRVDGAYARDKVAVTLVTPQRVGPAGVVSGTRCWNAEVLEHCYGLTRRYHGL